MAKIEVLNKVQSAINVAISGRSPDAFESLRDCYGQIGACAMATRKSGTVPADVRPLFGDVRKQLEILELAIGGPVAPVAEAVEVAEEIFYAYATAEVEKALLDSDTFTCLHRLRSLEGQLEECRKAEGETLSLKIATDLLPTEGKTADDFKSSVDKAYVPTEACWDLSR